MGTKISTSRTTAMSSTAGCGDRCEQGAVDAFGICVPDGADYQRADAITTALVIFEARLAANGTAACPDGGRVTITSSGGLVSDHTFVFESCLVTYDETEGSQLRFLSGTLRDQSIAALGTPTVFTHHVTGQAQIGGEVLVKGEPQSFAPETCSVDFTHVRQLLGDTAITGALCGRTLTRPLYE